MGISQMKWGRRTFCAEGTSHAEAEVGRSMALRHSSTQPTKIAFGNKLSVKKKNAFGAMLDLGHLVCRALEPRPG